MSEFDARAATWDANTMHTARTRAIAGAIIRKVPLASTMRALEIGAGTGLLGMALQDRVGSILFTDPSSGMIDVLNHKIADGGFSQLAARVLDLATDAAPEGPFELVFSQMALHHVQDVAGHLRILYRLMAPGATLCIADLDAEDGSFHGEGFHGHKGFERGELGALLVAAGFERIEFETVHEMEREIDGTLRKFPIFLLVARKPG